MAKVESIVRLMDALVNYEETIAFARLADEAYGTGGYLINDCGSYMSAQTFALTEGINLDKLREFLLIFGDVPAPIGCAYGCGKDASLFDALQVDEGLLAFCCLESSPNPIMGVLVKMSLLHARSDSVTIPSILQRG